MDIYKVEVKHNDLWYRCMPVQASKCDNGYLRWKCGKCRRGNIDPRFYTQREPDRCKICSAKVKSVYYLDWMKRVPNRIKDGKVFTWSF